MNGQNTKLSVGLSLIKDIIMKQIQIIQATEHMDWMDDVPTQILLIDGEEVEIESDPYLIMKIMEYVDEEDICEEDGIVRNQAINVLNEMLDQGHHDFDIDFYQSVLETLEIVTL